MIVCDGCQESFELLEKSLVGVWWYCDPCYEEHVAQPKREKAMSISLVREVTEHTENNPRQFVTVEAGEPNRGGAPVLYNLTARASGGESQDGSHYQVSLRFQDGHPGEAGYNGVLDSALLAVLIDRQKGFQKGPWASQEGAGALEHLERALDAMDARVKDRVTRDVMNKDEA